MPNGQRGAAEIFCLSLLLVSIASPFHASPPQLAEIASPERTFLGPDGNALPFRNDAEVIDFLLTADVIHEVTIGIGINRSRKMTLERNGVRANAIYRQADVTEESVHVGGTFYRFFRDSYRFEPAAYELALRLGITNIPPATRRRIGFRDGSLQIWIEQVLDEENKETFKPPNISEWVRQLRDMIFFDNFIYNADRNAGNILVTPDYTLMMIDHTRGFQERVEIMNPDRLIQVNGNTWERFQKLTEEEIRDTVRPYLAPREMTPLVRRHQLILEHIEALIDKRGEGAVIIP